MDGKRRGKPKRRGRRRNAQRAAVVAGPVEEDDGSGFIRRRTRWKRVRPNGRIIRGWHWQLINKETGEVVSYEKSNRKCSSGRATASASTTAKPLTKAQQRRRQRNRRRRQRRRARRRQAAAARAGQKEPIRLSAEVDRLLAFADYFVEVNDGEEDIHEEESLAATTEIESHDGESTGAGTTDAVSTVSVEESHEADDDANQEESEVEDYDEWEEAESGDDEEDEIDGSEEGDEEEEEGDGGEEEEEEEEWESEEERPPTPPPRMVRRRFVISFDLVEAAIDWSRAKQNPLYHQQARTTPHSMRPSKPIDMSDELNRLAIAEESSAAHDVFFLPWKSNSSRMTEIQRALKAIKARSSAVAPTKP